MSRPDRKRRHSLLAKIGTATAAATLLIGGGSVALASSGLETPWGWVADNVFHLSGSSGQNCFNGVRIVSDGPAEDPPSMRVAREGLQRSDVTTLDTATKESELRKEIDEAAGSAGTTSPIYRSDSQIKQMAVQMVLAAALSDGLHAKGYSDDEALQIHVEGQSTDCR